MSRCHLHLHYSAKALTLACSLAFMSAVSGCAPVPGKAIHSAEDKEIECNSRAYVRSGLGGYVTSRYLPHSPVRLGIIPFSAPANIASRGVELPGVGDLLAERLQAELLATGEVPIVEILPRQDWPRKKEEFFVGNFGALRTARDAGYDLVAIGYLQRSTSLNSLRAYLKVIDTDSNITVYYGETATQSDARDWRPLFDRWGWTSHQRRPDLLPTNRLIERLAACMTSELLNDAPPGETSEVESRPIRKGGSLPHRN